MMRAAWRSVSSGSRDRRGYASATRSPHTHEEEPMVDRAPTVPQPVQSQSGGAPTTAATPTRLGEVLIAIGSIAILVEAIAMRGAQGGPIAAGFFMVIVGLVIRFPTLLEDGTVTESGA